MRRHLHWPLPQRPMRRRFLALGLASLAIGLLIALLIWRNVASVNAFDTPVGAWFFSAGVDHPLLHQWASAWSWVADGPRNIAIVLVFAVVLLVLRAWPWAVFLVVVSQLGVVLSNILKFSIARTRPEFIEHTSLQTHLSFPSGHSFAGLTVWGALALICLYLIPRPLGRLLAVGCLVIGILQPVARLVVGKHWLTDVIGGQLLGLGWLMVCWSVYAALLTGRERRVQAQV